MKPSPHHSQTLLLVCVAFFGLALFVGCNEDSTAPIEDSGNRINPAITPRSVWESVQVSINSGERLGWEDALSPIFSYVPDPVSSSLHPETFDSWGRDSEITFISKLFSGDFVLSSQLRAPGFDIPPATGTEVTWNSVEYWVQVEGNGDPYPTTFAGVANIGFRLEGNFWYIISWTDLSGAAAPWSPGVVLPTLGELRAVMVELE